MAVFLNFFCFFLGVFRFSKQILLFSFLKEMLYTTLASFENDPNSMLTA